jgi:flagella basal body P-ring formation protein FlgA
MVDLRDVEPVPLVQRNDLVTVWVRRGRVAIKGSAKAMSSAGYGETVELTSELSRKDRFTGVVTGPKTVELPGASRTPLPGLTWGGGPR